MLWLTAALVAVLAVALLWALPHLRTETGTLVVVVAGRSASSVSSAPLMLGQGSGSWTSLGNVTGSVPAAPDQSQLLEAAVAVGTYDLIRFRGDVERTSISITAGRVEPLLLGIDAGNLIPGAVYAGNDEVNLGLGELAGKFVPMPAFDLIDQQSRAFNSSTTAGRNIVVAAFHTTCHETCPIYTALFFQLAKRVPNTVTLAEVTTDPDVDTQPTLADYAKRIGAGWEFVTGHREQVASFWKTFGVELSSGDVHASTLALIDRHGYVRLVYRGVPGVGNDVPPALSSSLNPEGLRQLASGGDGWGAPDVLQALLTIGAGATSSGGPDGKAPGFVLTATDGAKVSSETFAGAPVVINFWRSDCPPCKAEMPLLQRLSDGSPRVRLVLIDWGETADAATAFLDREGIHRPALLDTDLKVGRAYGVSALPTTVFVRPDGTIDRLQVGQIDERVLAAELSHLTSQ